MFSGLGIVMWTCTGESPSSVRSGRVVSGEGFPDFLILLKLEDKFTDNSESKDIIEFKADSLDEAWDTCQAEMPNIDKTVIGGGIESTCLQYKPGQYSCICLLKLHKKGDRPFKRYVFYLKNSVAVSK